MVAMLVERQHVREWCTTEQFAQVLGKAEFTVREWPRLGGVRAEKRDAGRGPFSACVISHQGLMRHQRESLLDVRPRRP